MPWPRRSKATSRNSSASALSYCLAQHRWFCDQPWMNRIGGPSGLPHSRTCSRRPPPPRTVYDLPRLVSPVWHALRHCCHRSPPRGRRLDRSSPSQEQEHIGRRALSFPGGRRIFRLRDAQRALPDGGLGAILAEMEARASDVFVGRVRELEELGRVLDACSWAAARPCSSPERPGSGRPAWRPSSPDAPVTPASRCSSGARSISSGPSCRTSRSSRRCGRSGSPCEQIGRARLAAAGVRGDARAARPTGQPPRRCCSCSRTSTGPTCRSLDLVVFLAHNIDDRPFVLLATYRADEPSSAERMRRLADGVRRSGSALVLELGPLERDELTTLLAARSDVSATGGAHRHDRRPLGGQPVLRRGAPRGCERPARRAPARAARPAAAARGSARRSDAEPVCGWPSAAGRDVGYPLLCGGRGASRSRTCASRCAGRSSTACSSPTRRRAASASATRCWRKRCTRRSCPASARSCTRASPTRSRAAERPSRRSWRRTGPRRVAPTEALVASVDAARQAEAVFGLAEALAHLERALTLWDAVPDAAELVGVDLAELCSWAAELASQTRRGTARRRAGPASDRARRRPADPQRVRHACTTGSAATCTRAAGPRPALAAFERVVELVPAEPPSVERARGAGGRSRGG